MADKIPVPTEPSTDGDSVAAIPLAPQVHANDPNSWFVLRPQGDFGPLPKSLLVYFIETGVVPPDALVRNAFSKQQWHARALVERAVANAAVPSSSVEAAATKEPIDPAAGFAPEAVEFPGFVGDFDPVPHGQGRVSVADGVVTLAIIAINLLVFVIGGFNGVGWISANAGLLLEFGGNFAVSTAGGQWWRLLSSLFLHGGLLHVAFNMWALWDAGRVAERLFGRWRYLALYTLAGVLGGIASINWQQDFVGIGASGAVFGVYGGLLAALLLRPDLLPGTVTRQFQASASVFVIYSLFNSFSHAGIDNAAHLGGLLAGALIGAALVMPMRRALAATAATLVLIGGGAVRAIEAAEPYRDELAFRQFLHNFAPAETRLNAIAADLGQRAKTLPPEEFLRVLEREVIPGWVEQDARIAALPHVTPRNRPLRDDMARFVHLRRESWETLGASLRRNDVAGIEAFKKKTAEANGVLEQIKARVENAEKGKRGKTS